MSPNHSATPSTSSSALWYILLLSHSYLNSCLLLLSLSHTAQLRGPVCGDQRKYHPTSKQHLGAWKSREHLDLYCNYVIATIWRYVEMRAFEAKWQRSGQDSLSSHSYPSTARYRGRVVQRSVRLITTKPVISRKQFHTPHIFLPAQCLPCVPVPTCWSSPTKRAAVVYHRSPSPHHSFPIVEMPRLKSAIAVSHLHISSLRPPINVLPASLLYQPPYINATHTHRNPHSIWTRQSSDHRRLRYRTS